MTPLERLKQRESVIKLTKKDIERLRSMKQKQQLNDIIVHKKGGQAKLRTLLKDKNTSFHKTMFAIDEQGTTLKIDWLTKKETEKFDALEKVQKRFNKIKRMG